MTLNRNPRHPRRSATTARRLDRRYGEPVVLVDTSTNPATVHPVARARVRDSGAGIEIDGGALVATGAALVVRLSADHWPTGLAVPDPATYPADRLRVVRGELDPEADPTVEGQPVSKVYRPAGVVVLEVT